MLGPVDAANILCSQAKNVNFVKYDDELSDQQMKQFLRLGDTAMDRGSKKGVSIEDQEALETMENSLRLVGGHFEVAMLWKSDIPWLPNNKQTIKARLQSLKRKLKRDENFHRKYREFMENLFQKGYARRRRWIRWGAPKLKDIQYMVLATSQCVSSPKGRAKFVWRLMRLLCTMEFLLTTSYSMVPT